MSVRTYNASVLIGNWNEDVCLEEVYSVFEYFNVVLSASFNSCCDKCFVSFLFSGQT